MGSGLFEQMLSGYSCDTDAGHRHAVREILQKTALAGLNRGGFFEQAAFYGGTCLRIFHELDRFSEDMDFSLLAPDTDFRLDRYLKYVTDEFAILGRPVTVERKVRRSGAHIESAFLKDDTLVYNIEHRRQPQLKIKIEVDTNPPPCFGTEFQLSLLPFSFMTRCYTLSSSFAGKMHALLFRRWKTRVKGRDWYDFEWYVRKNIPLDFTHFCERVAQFEGGGQAMTETIFFDLLKARIRDVDMEQVKADVRPFVENPSSLEIWSDTYFLALAEKIKIVPATPAG